ncbi:MAG: elongation factor G [Chitinivibrionales bacterium]|nr:elongation factor G [Chitinivibrionales bacterium]
MKQYTAATIRNVCLLSHGGVGKTSLMEAACFTAKGTSKLGKTSNGSSIFDARGDEKERKMTISMALGFCEWNDQKINFLDTPGFLDFIGDVKAALRVVESAVVLIDAVDGVQVGTEVAARCMKGMNCARLFFVNSCDKENVNFDKTIANIKATFGSSAAPIALPLGTGAAFKGIVNVITQEAFEYAREGSGIGKKIEVPADLKDEIALMRSTLMESVAESDEELMTKYFEKGELTQEELLAGLQKGVVAGIVHPVCCGSAGLNMGIDQFLNTISSLCPTAATRVEVDVLEDDVKKTVPCSPGAPAAGFIFKTISEEHIGDFNLVRVFCGQFKTGLDLVNTKRNSYERLGNMYFMRGQQRTDTDTIPTGDIGALLKLKDTHTNETLTEKSQSFIFPPTVFLEPVTSIAIASKNKGDEDKISVGIAKLREEDPTFTYRFHSDIKQSILSAMGDVHIEVILGNLKNRFKVEVERMQPKISYRETITKAVKYVEYTHKKQSGGAGQYAKVFIDLEPRARGEGYEFVDKIVGGVIDQTYRPSVDKGVHAKLDEGIFAGYPIVDLRVTLVDGKTHPVDSKDIAFQVAGREVFKKAFEMAGPILLEPVVNLKVTVPDEYTGDVMGDLSSRRGKISGMEPTGKYQTVNAKVPEAEILNYSATLRALTQGRGTFTKTFSHYETVPNEVAKKIVEVSKKETVAESE